MNVRCRDVPWLAFDSAATWQPAKRFQPEHGLDEDVDFTVEHGQYGSQELKSVLNTPKGLLPSTGGNGIYAFLLIGAALMIGSYAWFKKSKTQAEV